MAGDEGPHLGGGRAGAARSQGAERLGQGDPTAALPGLPAFDEFLDLVGLPEVQRLEERFRS